MKKVQILFTALCVAALLPGCGRKETSATGSAGDTTPRKKLKLAFVGGNAANFWTIVRSGCLDAQAALGDVSVDFRIPSTGSTAEQQQILNDLVAAGVDGIALSPVDPGNQTDFLNRIAEQTLLICAGSDAPDSRRVCHIGTDNEAAGEQAGGLIKLVLPKGGKIMLFADRLDAPNTRDRLAGIKKALAGSNVEIVDVCVDNTDPVRAQKEAEDALVKNPDLACLVGLCSYNVPAMANAVKGAGKPGQVRIICFDEDADTLAGVASGLIYATVVQQPYEFGRQAITRMDEYLHGDKSQLAGGELVVPTVVIKSDNVRKFSASWKKQPGD